MDDRTRQGQVPSDSDSDHLHPYDDQRTRTYSVLQLGRPELNIEWEWDFDEVSWVSSPPNASQHGCPPSSSAVFHTGVTTTASVRNGTEIGYNTPWESPDPVYPSNRRGQPAPTDFVRITHRRGGDPRVTTSPDGTTKREPLKTEVHSSSSEFTPTCSVINAIALAGNPITDPKVTQAIHAHRHDHIKNIRRELRRVVNLSEWVWLEVKMKYGIKYFFYY